MRNILFLLPSLDYHGDARQATLLAAALPRDRFHVECLSLGGPGPLGAELDKSAISVAGHTGQRLLDVEDWLGLRRLVRERRPDAIHAWGLPALGALRLASLGRWRRLPPLVVSSAARSLSRGKLGWWKRRLLGKARRVLAPFEYERNILAAAGLDRGRIEVVPPAVSSTRPTEDPTGLRGQLGVPPNARLIMAAGRMDTADRFRNAVWAFDILKYLAPDVWLVLIGAGPARPRIEAFSRSIGQEDVRVAFAGARPDAASLFHLAEVVWVANRQPGGTNVVLEALAAGKPVVASALPNLAAVIRDDETGFLVAPRDPPGLARRTRQLLDNPARARSVGEAGRRHVQTAFAPAAMAERLARLYDDVTSPAFA